MQTHRLTLLIILFYFLLGCGQSSLLKEVEPPVIDPAATAKRLEEQGDYPKAALEYQRIAGESIPPTQQDYQLSAITAFLKSGMLTEAKAELAKFDVTKSYRLENQVKLIHAKINLEEQHFSQAKQWLKGIEPTKLPKPLQLEYQQLHAQAIAAKGNVLKAIRGFREADRLTKNNPAVVKDNQLRLWNTLSSLNQKELQQAHQQVGNIQDPILSGWINLALVARIPYPKHLQQAINDWQLRFPNHPAAQDVLPHLVQETSDQRWPPQIALLLPAIDSQFGKYAEAIKNGFSVAADMEWGNNRPEITRYQVDAENIVEQYQQVVDAGADFVVGPLLKNTIAALADSQSQLPVPTLSLNYLGYPVTTGNLYQLGMSPEDEAKEVARRAWADEHKTALVLVPDGSWGERILETFRIEWKQLGGQSVTPHIYGNNFHLSIPKELKNATADMAFIVAPPAQARQIRPILNASLLERLPVYSISKVYSGIPNPKLDARLEGVMFVDMPWVLAPDENAVQLQASLLESWPEEMNQYQRLYALGVDAYYSVLQLQELNKQWQGQTGHLSVDNLGVISRDQLLWARFVNGEPQLVEEPLLEEQLPEEN